MQEYTEFPQYRAVHKYATISAQKVRVFADLIRGKYADEAITLLECYPNRGARMLEKVLKSAMHNAEDLGNPDIESLVIADVRVDEGPMQRRWRAGSRGVSTIIKKRSSHISVVLE
ncbi:MAG: 50S ribosomal protein L22 [Thermoguttaceae bacterium]|jgi:large subunit ribosomal protein L22|nr:50S ribosomal protein L22 [Thermoguttaceae bacterium]